MDFNAIVSVISALTALAAVGVNVWQVRVNLRAAARERVRNKLTDLIASIDQYANILYPLNGGQRELEDQQRLNNYLEQFTYAAASFRIEYQSTAMLKLIGLLGEELTALENLDSESYLEYAREIQNVAPLVIQQVMVDRPGKPRKWTFSLPHQDGR